MVSREYPNENIIPALANLVSEGRTISFIVKGNSMRPFLESERDKVILSPCKEIKIGDAILAKTDKNIYVLHRVVRIDGDSITLQGDGNVGYTETCQREGIVGIAKGFYRKGHGYPDYTDGRKWAVYSFIWMHTIFMRRYVLAFHRHVWLKLFPVKIFTK